MKHFLLLTLKYVKIPLPTPKKEKKIKLTELKHCLFHVKVLPKLDAIKRKAPTKSLSLWCLWVRNC